MVAQSSAENPIVLTGNSGLRGELEVISRFVSYGRLIQNKKNVETGRIYNHINENEWKSRMYRQKWNKNVGCIIRSITFTQQQRNKPQCGIGENLQEVASSSSETVCYCYFLFRSDILCKYIFSKRSFFLTISIIYSPW